MLIDYKATPIDSTNVVGLKTVVLKVTVTLYQPFDVRWFNVPRVVWKKMYPARYRKVLRNLEVNTKSFDLALYSCIVGFQCIGSFDEYLAINSAVKFLHSHNCLV